MIATTTRKLSVDYRHEFADGTKIVRVSVKDGKRNESYIVSRERDSLELTWKHVADTSRTYTVVCTIAGDAIHCDCKGSTFYGKCKHRAASTALLDNGELDNGPDAGEWPESWGWSAEQEEAEVDARVALAIGPKIHHYRD